jgi:hypothetical protein
MRTKLASDVGTHDGSHASPRSAAGAATPTLSSVDDRNRHPTATFSAPGADDATIYFATKPDRATDGHFLEENVKHLALLTANEVQAGRWLDSAQLDPGRYYVLLRASDYDCSADPNCTSGFSDVLTLAIPKPAPRYRGSVHAFKYLSTVRLVFRVAPLGARARYRVCWRLVTFAWYVDGRKVASKRARIPRR